jgi:hypothetical protein
MRALFWALPVPFSVPGTPRVLLIFRCGETPMAVWSASRTSGRPARTLQDGLAPTVGSGISQTFDSGVLRRKTVQEGEGKRDDQLMSTVPEAVRLEPARRVQNPKIGTQTPQETEARGTRLSAQRVADHPSLLIPGRPTSFQTTEAPATAELNPAHVLFGIITVRPEFPP